LVVNIDDIGIHAILISGDIDLDIAWYYR